MTPARTQTGTERLRRILVMLPYAIDNPGVTVDELAERFGVSRDHIIKDLGMLFVCGLPGYGPDDLIEVAIDDDGGVMVSTAGFLERPLRLTPAEALSLWAGAQALLRLPGMGQADALRRALDKLAAALGGGQGVSVELAAPGDALATVEEALNSRRRLRLRYYTAARDEVTERMVDPYGLVAALGRWYLVAWDHLREDERMFRVDRIQAAEVLDEPAEVPEVFEPERYARAFAGHGVKRVTLEISPEVAAWFADYYPIDEAEDLPDGWRRVSLPAGGDRWAALLLLELGPGARNPEPPEIAAEARRLAGAIAARHR